MQQHDEKHLPWLGSWLSNKGVSQIEASFSGGGDEGQMDDVIYRTPDKTELSSLDLSEELDRLKVFDGSEAPGSFYDVLADLLEKVASDQGNYYDGDGGSVGVVLTIHPDGIEVTESWFQENVFDDEDLEDGQDFEDEGYEP